MRRDEMTTPDRNVLKLYEFVVVFFFKMELPKHFETFAKGDWPV